MLTGMCTSYISHCVLIILIFDVKQDIGDKYSGILTFSTSMGKKKLVWETEGKNELLFDWGREMTFGSQVKRLEKSGLHCSKTG